MDMTSIEPTTEPNVSMDIDKAALTTNDVTTIEAALSSVSSSELLEDEMKTLKLFCSDRSDSSDSGAFDSELEEKESENQGDRKDSPSSGDVSMNSLPISQSTSSSSIHMNSSDTNQPCTSAAKNNRKVKPQVLPTGAIPPVSSPAFPRAIPLQLSHRPTVIFRSMSSTAIQVMPRAASSSSAAAAVYSPANSGHSDPSEEQLPNEQPLDFSKPSSQSSKTPPSSSEEESDHHHLPRGAAPRIDPIALTKSLAAAAAASAYFPQHPKYMKTEHCFSTPSPSPPERTHHHHFGLPVVGSPVTSAAPVASSTSPEDAAAASNNAVMASQMFGLLASQFATNQTSAMLNPLAAANGAIANSNLLKAIQLAGAAGGSQQQAALISALMQSTQTGTNLELLKSLTSSQSMAMHHHQQQQQSSPKLASPVATTTIPGYLMAAAQPVTTVASSNAAAAAIGLLSTAGAQNLYHQAQAQAVHHSDLMTSTPSSAPMVDSTYRSTNQHRTSPPATTHQKYTRPFKALYNNKDSFNAQSPFTPAMAAVTASPSVATDSLATQSILLSNSDAAYQEFRNKMLVTKTRGERSPGSSHGGGSRPAKMTDLMHHSDDAHSVVSSNSSDGLDCSSAGDSQQNIPYSVAASYPMTTSSGISSISVVAPCSQLAPSILSPATPVMTNTNSNSSNHSGSNSASRKRGRPLPEDLKDDAYWERRRKNNEAAKRSRDLRRAKEDEIAIRAAFLEQENFKLKCELVQSRIECDKIRALWLNTQQGQAAAQAQQLSPTISMTPDQAALAAMLQIQKGSSPK